jgi:hypothetical protein
MLIVSPGITVKCPVLTESYYNIVSVLNLVLGLTNSPLESSIRLFTIGLWRRWNDYSTHDSFDLVDMQSGFPTSYPWKRRTPAKFRYV